MTFDERIKRLSVSANPSDTVTCIAVVVSKETGIPLSDIMGRTLTHSVSQARQVVMFEAKEMGLTFDAIGEALGRNHATIIAGYRREAARRGITVNPTPRNLKRGTNSQRRPHGIYLSAAQLEDYRHLVDIKRLPRAQALEIIGVQA